MAGYSSSCVRRLNIVKVLGLSTLIDRLRVIPSQKFPQVTMSLLIPKGHQKQKVQNIPPRTEGQHRRMDTL